MQVLTVCDVVHAGAHCVRCRKEHSLEHVRQAVSQGRTRCDCTKCGEAYLYFLAPIAFVWLQIT